MANNRFGRQGRWLKSLLLDEPRAAVQTLTILRLGPGRLPDEATLGRSQVYLPAVGLLLGLMLYGLAVGPLDGSGAGLTGWLLAASLALSSGALHLDGLADTADGLFGGRTPERRLAIMRESSVGAFAVVAVVLVLGLKAASLAEITAAQEWQGLVLAPALARWGAVAVIFSFPYARPEGFGGPFRAHASTRRTLAAAAIALGASFALAGFFGLALFAGASLAALALGSAVRGRLGGVTGDSYGATIECIETGALIAFAASSA